MTCNVYFYNVLDYKKETSKHQYVVIKTIIFHKKGKYGMNQKF